jgi:hypothetical protein
MRWMEMIRLRTPQNDEKWLPELLSDSTKNAVKEPGLLEVKVYRNASFQGDLSVTFLWETDSPRPQGSRPALSLSQTLKAFGLVEYSVWIESNLNGTTQNTSA